MPRHTDHMGLVITTNSAAAAARYADGVELLVGSSPDAVACSGPLSLRIRRSASRSPRWPGARAGQAGTDGGAPRCARAAAGGIVAGHPSGTTAHRDRGRPRCEATVSGPAPSDQSTSASSPPTSSSPTSSAN